MPTATPFYCNASLLCNNGFLFDQRTLRNRFSEACVFCSGSAQVWWPVSAGWSSFARLLSDRLPLFKATTPSRDRTGRSIGVFMPVVELSGVTKAYEQKVAVSNLSLSIEAGQMFGLLGPNGAGKTSSIRMIIGITMPDSGRVSLFGKPFERASLDRVGYLPEERGLYKKMKVLDQLVFFGELHGIAPAEARKRAVIWAKRLEIDDVLLKKTEELSKGMQQKIQ